MAKKVVVIRVSEKTIRMVHMDNVSNNPVVYGCVRVPTPEGAVVDGMIVNPVEISKRIEKACLEKAIHTKDVIFTISSTKIASRETEIPAVQKAKVESVVMAKVPDLFPVDMDRYIFSYKVQGADYEDEEKGKLRSVRIFAAPSELVESYYKLADEAGLNVISVDSDVNSVFQIVSRQVKEKESVTMCIQINRDNTLVNIVTSDKLLLQRVIPYGVTVFTDAMVAEPVFQVEDYDHAFKVLSSQRVLMHNLNSVNPSGDFSTEKRIEVTANGEHLISNISRVMEYYNSRFRHNEINHVICVGSGCSIAGIHELLTMNLVLK
ncbi:MAG: pilus assembly protein PilM [Eubacterium sp.]|nr:pilus assembly protein PilM [Eubacterium sp.]